MFAVEGGACSTDGAAGCSPDRTTVYWCEAGVWEEAQHCPPSQCARFDGLVGCANRGVSEGDTCKSDVSGGVICSTDLTKILSCQNGTAVVNRECSGGTQCTLTDGDLLDCL